MFSIKSILNPSNLFHTCAAMVAECAKHGKSTSKDMLQNRLIKAAYFFQELKKMQKGREVYSNSSDYFPSRAAGRFKSIYCLHAHVSPTPMLHKRPI